MSNKVHALKRANKLDADKEATITVSMADLVNARPVLGALMREKFPEGKGKLSLEFGRLCRDAFKELETAYDPAYNELLKKHGDESKEKPGQFEIRQDEVEAFKKAVDELVSAEITLLHKSLPEIADVFALSGVEALALEWLL